MVRAWVLAITHPPGSLSFPVWQARWNLIALSNLLRIREGEPPLGRLGRGQGAGCGAAGRGEEAGPAVGRPGCRGGGRVSQRAVRATAERAARRAAASHELRRRERSQPAGGRPHSCSPVPPPALTMSICCCFFFRDYGSSKRKSGKGVSALFFLTSQLHARVPQILRRTFGGGGDVFPACGGTVVLPVGGRIGCPFPVPSSLSSLSLTPSFSSLVLLTP